MPETRRLADKKVDDDAAMAKQTGDEKSADDALDKKNAEDAAAAKKAAVDVHETETKITCVSQQNKRPLMTLSKARTPTAQYPKARRQI
jgi:hypothetical protein